MVQRLRLVRLEIRIALKFVLFSIQKSSCRPDVRNSNKNYVVLNKSVTSFQNCIVKIKYLLELQHFIFMNDFRYNFTQNNRLIK